MNTSNDLTFEQCFKRLEEILEKLNTGQLSLEDSLKIYEEADKLLTSCNKKLHDAEQKIEVLVKNRNGELQTGADQKPQSQNFTLPPPPKS